MVPEERLYCGPGAERLLSRRAHPGKWSAMFGQVPPQASPRSSAKAMMFGLPAVFCRGLRFRRETLETNERCSEWRRHNAAAVLSTFRETVHGLRAGG